MVEIIEACFYAILHNGEIADEETIREFWDQQVSILSNKFLYNENIGFDYERPIIHILNKQKFIYDFGHVANKPFRRNVLIMGDILDDVKMIRDTKHDVVLKVGFLNDMKRTSHLLDEFSKAFDIVITGDGSLQPINFLLNKVFAKEI